MLIYLIHNSSSIKVTPIKNIPSLKNSIFNFASSKKFQLFRRLQRRNREVYIYDNIGNVLEIQFNSGLRYWFQF